MTQKLNVVQKLQKEYGMSLRGTGRECDYDYHAVNAHLNILKLPEKYQELVWNGPISVSHIQELEPLFNGGEVTTSRIIDWLDRSIERKLTSQELRGAVHPELREQIKTLKLEETIDENRELLAVSGS